VRYGWVSTLAMAWRALSRNRMRSALTMLGIIIGVGSVIALVTIGQSVTRQVTSEVEQLGDNLIWIQPRRARGAAHPPPPLTLEDARAVAQQVAGVRRVAPAASVNRRVLHAGASWATTITGITNDYFDVRRYRVGQGRDFTDAEIASGASLCILGSAVVRELFGASSPLGDSVRIQDTSCRVVGVLAKKKTENIGDDEDDVVLMPLNAYHRRIAGNRDVEVIFVSAQRGRSTALVSHQLRMLVRERRRIDLPADDDFRVRDLRAAAARITSITDILTILLAAIAGVSLLVGGIGIMNMMLVSVTERTHEIGIRLAIGARSSDVLWQFLVEAILLSSAGGAAGVGLGLLGSWGATSALKLGYAVVPEVVAVAFLFSAGVGVLFGFMPARRAARLQPIEALRHD